MLSFMKLKRAQEEKGELQLISRFEDEGGIIETKLSEALDCWNYCRKLLPLSLPHASRPEQSAPPDNIFGQRAAAAHHLRGLL